MPLDPFKNTANSLVSPASRCFTIAPDDAQELLEAPKAIYIGTGGDIVLRPLDNEQDIVLRNAISGSILDIRVRAIRSTGTTAQDIVGLV